MVLGNLTNDIGKLSGGLAPKAFNNTTKSFEYTPACPEDTAGGPVLLHECKPFM
jgi:hypothetical protein